jgi:hypothetical protein
MRLLILARLILKWSNVILQISGAIMCYLYGALLFTWSHILDIQNPLGNSANEMVNKALAVKAEECRSERERLMVKK